MSENIDTRVTGDPFTPVPNYIINDPGMLIEAKMTWIYLFSKRNIPGWRVHPRHIQKILGYKDFVWRKVSQQLHELGYLVSKKIQGGTLISFVWDWDELNKSFKPGLTLVDKYVDKL